MTGEDWYAKGKEYDLSSENLAGTTLARIAFQNGHQLGHTGCSRALAGMLLYGVGGDQDTHGAIKLMWMAYLGGDHEALDELEDALEELASSSQGQAQFELERAAVAFKRVREGLVTIRDLVHSYTQGTLNS